VIRAKGIAAWLALHAAAPPARPAPASPATRATTSLPGGLPAGQIVTVLAAMTLAAARPP
jgi:hypothetical protein